MKNNKEIKKTELSSLYGRFNKKTKVFDPNQLYGKPKTYDINSMYPKDKPSN